MRTVWRVSLMCAIAYFVNFHSIFSHPLPLVPEKGTRAVDTRDGQHDFDFNFGTWKTHMKRLKHPLTGSTEWVELNGTVVVRKVWDGRAQLEEVEADGPNGHFEDLGLFLYSAEARQWSLNFASSKTGVLGVPPTVGEFKDGSGEFYDQETYNGRAILARIVWSDITVDSHKFEQAFSDDNGKTWETNVVADLTRVKQPPRANSDKFRWHHVIRRKWVFAMSTS